MSDFQSNVIVLPEYRIAFWAIEKVASSSIKAAFRQALEKPDEPWKVTRERVVQTAPVQALDLSGWLTAAFVRNPSARLVSTWRSKIRTDAVLLRQAPSLQPGMSFTDFAERIGEVPDRHVAPQHRRMLKGDTLMPARIYMLEGVSHYWPKFCELAMERGLRLPALGRRNESEFRPVDPADAELWAHYWYQRDYELFGYA